MKKLMALLLGLGLVIGATGCENKPKASGGAGGGGAGTPAAGGGGGATPTKAN